MPRDADILAMRKIGGMSNSAIADFYGLNQDSVRKRGNRAAEKPANHVHLIETLLASGGLRSTAEERLQIKTEEHAAAFEASQEELRKRGGVARIVWTGDAHFPTVRLDALDLALQIIADLQPDYVITLNDLFNNSTHGKHPKFDRPEETAWARDVELAVETVSFWHGGILHFAPNAKLLGLMGNHDRWMIYDLWERRDMPFSASNALWFWECMEEQGVILPIFDPMRENILQMSPGLKLVHGVSAASRDTTVASATLNRCAGSAYTNDQGVFYHTCSGHVHRDFKVNMFGVSHTNFGTLGTLDPAYMKHRPNGWTLGIGVIEYEPGGRWVESEPVRFTPDGNSLRAHFRGRRFTTELRK